MTYFILFLEFLYHHYHSLQTMSEYVLDVIDCQRFGHILQRTHLQGE